MPKKPAKTTKKPLSAADLKAIDWQALLAKLPAFAALIGQIIALLGNNAKDCPDTDGCVCCQEVKDANDADLEALAQYLVSRMQLCDAICACDCDDDSK